MLKPRRSRCTIPRETPLHWRDFVDDDDEEVVSFYRWLQTLGQLDQEMVVGRILGLRELAAAGEIGEFDEESLKPIRRDPELYELRWDELGTLIRQYHGEPDSLRDYLINLHIHIKQIAPGSPALTDDLQDIQISHAMMRYQGGKSRNWQQ